jgi:hypothetical protein
MIEENNRERMDLNVRIFLLDLLDGRELSFSQIRQSLASDYHEKKYIKQEVMEFLVKLRENHLISRKKLSKKDRFDRCRNSYTITDRGIHRKKYYQKQLEGQENK